MSNVTSKSRFFASLVLLSLLLLMNLLACSVGSHREQVYVASSQIPKTDFPLLFFIGNHKNVVEIYAKREGSRLVAVREMMRSEHAHPISQPPDLNWKKNAKIVDIDLSQKLNESVEKLDCGDVRRGRIIAKKVVRGGGHFLESESPNGKCITSESFDKNGQRFFYQVERTDVPGGITDMYNF